ncbi:MAG TPA: SIR2 family protein [bacterium]|nr:SIR2 family protein [bacterium]
MANLLPDIPDELIEAIVSNRCVLFAGSGVSRGKVTQKGKSVEQYLPTWEGLLVLLVDRAIKNGYTSSVEGQKLRRAAKDGKYLFVAETVRKLLGAREFDDALEEIFRNPALHHTKRHELISQIPFNCVVTTNYDKLLEVTYARRGNIPPTYTFYDSPDVISALSHNRFFILKAHGDIDRKDSLVLSEKDYRDIVYRQPGYRAALNTIFITKTVLFLGTSLNDIDVRVVLESVSESFSGKGPQHFAIVPSQSFSDAELQHWKQFFGIHLLLYRATKGHPQVDNILEVLVKKVESKKSKK